MTIFPKYKKKLNLREKIDNATPVPFTVELSIKSVMHLDITPENISHSFHIGVENIIMNDCYFSFVVQYLR